MRFTILGASGFIGRSLAHSLRCAGHEVSTPPRDIGATKGQHLGHVIYSIGLTADFRERPFDTVRAHVGILSEVLEHADFESLLYLSSTRVYAAARRSSEDAPLPVDSANPSDLYNLSKLMGESLCLSSGRKGTRIVRLSNVVGFDHTSRNFLTELIREALGGRIVLRSALQSSKDYVALADVVALLPRIAIEGRASIYNVASGRNIPNSRITKLLQSLTGCSVVAMSDVPAQRFPAIHIEKIRQEFGFIPSDPLAALPELIAAHRQKLGLAQSQWTDNR